MDAESEVSRTAQVAECGDLAMDTDDSLDKLLRKAVTVSQANLPIATINKDIDEIASAYAKEIERPDKALDDDFVRLLERTRQRRELLDQKMGKGPEAAPRKRRSPLCEDLTSNVRGGSRQTEDSPKRQCVREQESSIKPDTPAIASVKSRLHALSSQRAYWAEEGTENPGDSSPVPTPRKSMVSPPVEPAKPATHEPGPTPQSGSQRKSRFAKLASNISSWEDDLSHPSVMKEEEKKSRWQPPKARENSPPAPSNSTKGSHDPAPTSASVGSKKSPVKSAAKTVDSASTSSVRPGTKAGNSGVAQTSRSPVKSAASSRPELSKKVESSGSQETEAEQEKEDKPRKEAEGEESSTNKSRKEEGREMQGSSESRQKDSISSKREETRREALKPDGHKTGLETPKAVMPPTERPLSTRLANWEQKISDSKSEAVSTPKPTLATPGKATPLPKKGCTPARPLSTPLVEESEAVQMRPKARGTVEDEPTAHSVSARMSAWEHISSNQEVSSIKKVKPGDCTPAKTPAAQKSPMKTGSAATPAKPLAQEGIKERIAQLSTPQRASNTPSKTQALLGSATKSAQWQSAQQSNSSDVAAQRLREARMAELQGIQSRWKNGILQEDASQQPEEAPTAESSVKKDKRQGLREKARADEREADSIESNATEDTNLEEKNIKKISSSEEEEEEKMSVDPEISAAVEIEVQTADDSTRTAASKEKQSAGQDSLDQKRENIDSAMPNENPQWCQAVHTDGPSVEPGNATQDAVQPEIHGESPTATTRLEGAAPQEVSLEQNGWAKEQGSVQTSAVQADGQSGERAACSGGADEQTHAEEGHPADSADGTSGQKNTSTGAGSPTNATSVEPLDGVCSQTACAEEKKEQASTELPVPEASEASNFDSKLATVGLDAPSRDTAASSAEDTAQGGDTATDVTATCSSQAPAPSSSGVVSGKPPRPTSLFSIVSQQKAESAATATNSPRPVSGASVTSKACRKVKFDDGFDGEDCQAHDPKKVAPEDDDGGPEEDMEVVLRRPPPASQQQRPLSAHDDNDDDVSMSAFVPRSVRFQNVLPSEQDLDSSINSLDSFDGAPGAPPDFHKSTVDLVKLGQQYADSDSCSSLDTVAATSTSTAVTAGSSSSKDPQNDQQQQQQQHHQAGQDLEESVDDRDAIDDLLDEAMDSEEEQEEEEEAPVMRKKNNQREASRRGGDLPFSINEYRASRNMQLQEAKQTIVRNSQYVGMSVKEEDVEMPSAAPTPAPRRSAQDKIKELQELVQQEQSVIMQTSNALNQCCSSTSHFAGSSEQVECNRILLISCQKRQVYMTEIQRLKNGSAAEPSGPCPKGSITISDIRLPLKKDFVTKIGTSQDTMTYYFILLVRNGPQVITTQMLSTHDPMMRGSLDFPNLIKVNGITGSFQLQMDIYCMSVSCEALGKDKKKKTPKKFKGSALAVQSPGGPMAVRMTSFTQVTTVLLTMKSVDKHCFSLDRLSHLSPLHGTIYMNLKCLMEANVEEKGFLTMFEDVSGLGSWHRRWCVLSGNRLQFWKYPDDETRKEPMGYVDLKRCVTEKVGLISRDVCARPHTFELTSVRQPKKGEKDTLVSRTYSTMTTVRHMLSADTKEERIVWCNKLNRALATIRTWHTDAMRPIPK